MLKALNLSNQEFSRQLDIVPTELFDKRIAIIGCGAIGSWTAITLAKMGIVKNVLLIDHDTVDMVNMSSQFFGIQDIGKEKVVALASRIKEMTGSAPDTIAERWTPNSLSLNSFDIVISAVDSMSTRNLIFNTLADKAVNCKAFIDARMGAETALLYTMNPMVGADQEAYNKTLYTDQEAVQAPCTAKSTTYCAVVLSGLVAKTVRDVLTGNKYMRTMQLSLKDNALECQSR